VKEPDAKMQPNFSEKSSVPWCLFHQRWEDNKMVVMFLSILQSVIRKAVMVNVMVKKSKKSQKKKKTKTQLRSLYTFIKHIHNGI
jgi:hypothetical protein